MEKLRAGIEFIFSSYKRSAAVLFIATLTLSIPITISLVSQQQDIRQRAQEQQIICDPETGICWPNQGPEPSPPEDSFIRIAADNWHFETTDGKPFYPFGAHYTPAWMWPPTYILDDAVFDETKIDQDFSRMENLGLNVVKVMIGMQYFLPYYATSFDDPNPKVIVRREKSFQRLDKILDLAKKHNLKIILTIDPGGGSNPLSEDGTPLASNGKSWWIRGNLWFGTNEFHPVDNEAITIMADIWRSIAEHYKDRDEIFAYSLAVEATQLYFWDKDYITEAFQWGYDLEPKASYQSYLKGKYGTISTLSSTWGTSFTSWTEISPPPCESAENDIKLYDFQQFRQFIAVRYFKNMVDAIKRADPSHLVSGGIGNAFLYARYGTYCTYVRVDGTRKPVEGTILNPNGVPEFDLQKLAEIFDYMSIHAYPNTYPWSPGSLTEDELRLKKLRLTARYAYNVRFPKPVIVEEFNWSPADYNLVWGKKLIQALKNDVSGFIVWTFQNTPNSDHVTKVAGLYDESGQITTWGATFQNLGAELRNTIPRRAYADRMVPIQRLFLSTTSHPRSIDANIQDTLMYIINNDMKYCTQGIVETCPIVDFVESTPPTQTPSPTPTPTATPTSFPTSTPTPPQGCVLHSKGDANCDGKVNTDDFNIWRDEFLQVIASKSSDFNPDGVINTDDFNIWRDSFINA